MKKQRNLCYTHHCQEFDKLPNALRHLAAGWRIVLPAECELCQEELEQARAALAATEAGE